MVNDNGHCCCCSLYAPDYVGLRRGVVGWCSSLCSIGINIPHWYRIEHTVPPAPLGGTPLFYSLRKVWRYQPSLKRSSCNALMAPSRTVCTASLHPTYILHFKCCITSLYNLLNSRIRRYESLWNIVLMSPCSTTEGLETAVAGRTESGDIHALE